MKKALQIATSFFCLLILAIAPSSAQIPKTYVPLSFSPESPLWTHTFKDTSRGQGGPEHISHYRNFIGPVDFDIRDGVLYTLYDNLFVNVGDGLFAEKINLEDGASLGTYLIDPRKDSMIKQLKPIEILLQDNGTCNIINTTYQFIDKTHTVNVFDNSILDVASFQLEDRYFSAPEDSIDPGVDNLRFSVYVRNNDTSMYYYDMLSIPNSQNHTQTDGIAAKLLDQRGKVLWDTTVIYDEFSLDNLPIWENAHPYKLYEIDNNLLGIISFHYYKPDSIVAKISYFDHRLHLIEEHDLSYAFDSTTMYSYVKRIDKNYIYVVAKLPNGPFAPKYWTYLIFDRNGNLVERIRLTGVAGRMYQDDVFPIRYPKLNKTVLLYNDNKHGKFSVLYTEGNGVIRYLKNLTMSPEGMGIRMFAGTVLSDGDILLLGDQIIWAFDSTRSIYTNNAYAKLLVRFDQHLLDPLLSTNAVPQGQDYTIIANPVHSLTALSFDAPFKGVIHLIDAKGQIRKTIISKGQRQVPLDMNGLEAGTYFVSPHSANVDGVHFRTKQVIKLE